MWTEIKKEFLIGFNEGWASFWSPFTGLWKAFANTWNNHIDCAGAKVKHQGLNSGEIKATGTKSKI